MTKNHNFRFNLEREEEKKAWDILHSKRVEKDFKSQNRFVVKAINDYYERHLKEMEDPYLSSREKEEAFIDRIIETVNEKLFKNLPELIGQYILSSGITGVNSSMVAAKSNSGESSSSNVDEGSDVPADNELLDFDVF